MLRTFHQPHQSGDKRTEMARSWPGHLQGRRGSGVGELVLQVCGNEQGGQRREPRWKQHENMRGKVRDVKERGDPYYDQTSAQKMESRTEIRQRTLSGLNVLSLRRAESVGRCGLWAPQQPDGVVLGFPRHGER